MLSHFPWKSYQGWLALILSVLTGIEKALTGKWQASIDAEEPDPYIGFTESRTDLWESFGKRSIDASLSGYGGLSLAEAIEHLPAELARTGFSIPAPKRPARAPRTSQSRIFQDLRAYGHDRKQESSGGNPPSGQ